jgi:hypothetical protein
MLGREFLRIFRAFAIGVVRGFQPDQHCRSLNGGAPILGSKRRERGSKGLGRSLDVPAGPCLRLARPRVKVLFAYAVVKHPLIGGGVAEWLKAAVC